MVFINQLIVNGLAKGKILTVNQPDFPMIHMGCSDVPVIFPNKTNQLTSSLLVIYHDHCLYNPINDHHDISML